jgi:ribosomal protein L32
VTGSGSLADTNVPLHTDRNQFCFLSTFTMAAISASFLPRLSAPTLFSSSRLTLSFRQFAQKLGPTLSIAIPGLSLNLPTLDDIWEGLLRAVPKNKVSHSKKRSRQMAGKALKDVNNLCRCPGCGELKRTHRLCQHCLEGN